MSRNIRSRRWGSGGQFGPTPTVSVPYQMYPGCTYAIEVERPTSLDGDPVSVKVNGIEAGNGVISGGACSVSASITRSMAGASLGDAVPIVVTVSGVEVHATSDVYWYTQDSPSAVFDGLDTSTFTLGDGNVVDAWNDVSGNDHHLAHAGDTKLVRDGSINGHAAIRGTDSASGYLTASGCEWEEIAVVCEYGSALFGAYPGVASGISQTGLLGSPGTDQFYNGGHYYYGEDALPHLRAGMTHASVSGIHLFPTGTYASDIVVGSERNSVGRQWGGKIGDVIFFTDTLSDAARLRVNACASARWRAGGETIQVYLIAGQSNAVGVPQADATTKAITPVVGSLLWEQVDEYPGDNPWPWQIYPWLRAHERSITWRHGAEITMLRDLATGITPAVPAGIMFAQWGTEIALWLPGTTLWGRWMEAIRKALATLLGSSRTLTGILWNQGESDAETQARAEAYEANLTYLINSVRAELGAPDLVFCCVKFGSVAEQFPYRSTVHAAIDAVALALDHVVTVDATGLDMVDAIHYSTSGNRVLGEMVAAAFLAA